jgi:hypothetical protein
VNSTNAALGARLKTYAAAKAKYWLIPLGVVIFAGGVFVALGPWLFPDPRAGLGTEVGIAVLGLFFMLLGFGAAASVLRQRNRRVHVHEHGIVEERGERRVEMLWDEVVTLVSARQRVTQAVGLVTHHIESHTLKTDAGKKLVLDHLLADISALGEEVERQVSRCLLPKIQARLAKSESVSFSPLTVTDQSIVYGQKTLAWEQVAGAETAHGEVRIFRHGEPSAWVKVRYGSLTNARALLTLISSRIKARQA